MFKTFLALAAASGFLAVILGAFGAHGLKAYLDQAALSTWQTAVHYQFFHTLALLALALLARSLALPSSLLLVTGCLFTAGILLFSGSLYGMALGGPRWLGPVTPLGGACFIAGWASLFLFALRTSAGNT